MADTPGPKLLYVEDDPVIAIVAVDTFAEAGFEVTALHSGAAAIETLDARAGEFKALVTDIDLAGGPDRWRVARHARELVPDLAIIYVTGGSAGDWASMGVPGSLLVAKPSAAGQLVVAVSTAMLGGDGLTAS